MTAHSDTFTFLTLQRRTYCDGDPVAVDTVFHGTLNRNLSFISQLALSSTRPQASGLCLLPAASKNLCVLCTKTSTSPSLGFLRPTFPQVHLPSFRSRSLEVRLNPRTPEPFERQQCPLGGQQRQKVREEDDKVARWLAPGDHKVAEWRGATVTAQSGAQRPLLLGTIKASLSSLLLHRSSAVASSTASPSWKMALMPS